MNRKYALVTGASRGIGRAAALALAEAGYNLAITCSRDTDGLKTTKGLISEYSRDCITGVFDAGDFDECSEFTNKVLDRFGRLDVLVNNAGISYIGLLQDMSYADWNRVISTNLTSVFNMCRLVIPSMVHEKNGRIINISSVWGNTGAACEVAYSASKGGINALTKALGKELAPSNIAVNAIACGVVDTDMNRCFSDEERESLKDEIPADRFASPEEIAQMVLYLANSTTYLTGQVITIDGGWI